MVWFGIVWFLVFQLVKMVLVSIRTKFELSMCIVCPTIDINMRIGQPQNVGFFFFFVNGVRSRTLPILSMGSVENIMKCKYMWSDIYAIVAFLN